MENQKIAISLLFLTVLVAGCAESSSSNAAIELKKLSVEPNEIYEDTSVSVSLGLENTGNLPAEIRLGQGGEKVMKNYCPDMFENSEFSVTTSGEYDEEDQVVELAPDRDLNLRWRLEHTGNTPLYGERCDLDFVAVFNYSVSAFKQVQIKRDEEVEGSPELRTQSSDGPLFFGIETVGSTGNPSTFASGLDKEVTTHLQLQNHGQEGVAKGVVDIHEESLSIEATEPLGFEENYEDWSGDSEEPVCDVSTEDELRIFEGESRVITCNIDTPSSDELESPAQISEIFAEVNYTYRKDLGSRRVEVEKRG